jgi:CBS domain-containing protein
MLVKDVMAKDLTFCTPEETVAEVAKLMKSADVGAIPVVQDKSSRKLVGIVTDRDIVISLVAAGKDPKTTTVGSIMSRDLVSAKPDEELERSARLMQEKQVRRIPIVDEQGAIVGIVAQADIAQESPSDQTVRETVEKVSTPKKGKAA